MTTRLFILLGLLLIGRASFCQQLTMVKTFGGVRFESDTLTYSAKQVLELMRDNQPAYIEFKRAKSNYDGAGVMGFVGGLLIGFPLGTAIVGGEPEWGLAAGGAGLLLLSIPLNSAFKRHAQSAIDTYNAQLTSSRKIKPTFYFTGTGGKLILRF